jgi:PTS system nitrogen regulatory IIA component
MQISDLIRPDKIKCFVNISSKKRLLDELSVLLSEGTSELSQVEIFDSLVSRERLGSTGLGHGVAIPHGRMKVLKTPLCAFVKLDEGTEFDSPDNVPVDLLFALIVPEESTEQHLQLLATIAEMFSDPALCRAIRGSKECADIYNLLTNWEEKRKTA